MPSEVNLDDDRMRVITWTLAAGEGVGWHTHEFDYLVVPVTGGHFRVPQPDGSEKTMEQVAGSPYMGTAGTEHDVINAGDTEAVFVEIELKPS
jgi:quercetin dioxygenase-like cupin family protein